MDFKLTDDLDFSVTDGSIDEQENNETTLMTAIFTDSRVRSRGYWLELKSTELWTKDQARSTSDTAREIEEDVRETTDKLVEDKLFDQITVNCYELNGIIILNIFCYNDSNMIMNRSFRL